MDVKPVPVRRGVGEAELVRCLRRDFDVIMDLRPGSPTYRNWESLELHDREQVWLYVSAGCAYGFQALTEPADVSYRIDRPTEDLSIAFDDPELAILASPNGDPLGPRPPGPVARCSRKLLA